MAKIVRITWTDPSPTTNVDHLEIWRSINGGASAQVGSDLALGVQTYDDDNGGPGFSDGDDLDYSVRAYNSSGQYSDVTGNIVISSSGSGPAQPTITEVMYVGQAAINPTMTQEVDQDFTANSTGVSGFNGSSVSLGSGYVDITKSGSGSPGLQFNGITWPADGKYILMKCKFETYGGTPSHSVMYTWGPEPANQAPIPNAKIDNDWRMAMGMFLRGDEPPVLATGIFYSSNGTVDQTVRISKVELYLEN